MFNVFSGTSGVAITCWFLHPTLPVDLVELTWENKMRRDIPEALVVTAFLSTSSSTFHIPEPILEISLSSLVDLLDFLSSKLSHYRYLSVFLVSNAEASTVGNTNTTMLLPSE